MYPHMIHMWYLICSSKLRTSLLRSAFFQHDGPVHRRHDCSLSTSPSVQLLSANIRKLCVGSLKLNNKDCLMNHHFCLISRHAGGGGFNCMEDILLAHSGPINTNWAMFKCHSLTWYNHVNLFLTTVSTLSGKWWNLSQSWDYLKSFQESMASVHLTQLTSKLTRSHSISPHLRCGGVEDLHCGGEADKSAQCYLISMSHSLSEWAKISEGWNLSVTILYQKQRKHKWSNEMFKASPSLSPFLWEYMTL